MNMEVLNKDAFKKWAKSHMVENPNYIDGLDGRKYISFWECNNLNTIWKGHMDAMSYIFNVLNSKKDKA